MTGPRNNDNYDDIYSGYGEGDNPFARPAKSGDFTPPTAEFNQIDERMLQSYNQDPTNDTDLPPVLPPLPPTPPPKRRWGLLITLFSILILTIIALASVVVLLLTQHRAETTAANAPVLAPAPTSTTATTTSTTTATTTSSTSATTTTSASSTTTTTSVDPEYKQKVESAGLQATGFSAMGCLDNDKWRFAAVSTGGKHVLICESASSGELYYTHDYMPETYRKKVDSGDISTGTFQIVNEDATIDVTKLGLTVTSKKGVELESTFEQSFVTNPYP